MKLVIVRLPKLPRLRARRVAFDADAALELGREAQEAGEWRYYADYGGSVANSYKYYAETEAVCAIAAPTGVIAVWFGRANASRASLKSAALAATESPSVAAIWATVRSERLTHLPLACAAARILHARACGEPIVERDELIAEWFGQPWRPETRLLIAASLETLRAASALRHANANKQVEPLLKRAIEGAL